MKCLMYIMNYMGFLKSVGAGLLLMLVSQRAFCQEGVTELEQKWDAYQHNTLQEKLYVHTDKSTYLAGELLWFKIYDTDAQNKLQQVSQVAYVDVLDMNHKFIAQVKVALKEGTGSGSVFLPLGAATGHYTLRAYTNWMKNFGVEQFFEKPIAIINTLKRLEPSVTDTTNTASVRFFPEGGNLVTGLESNVAVQVLDTNGSGSAFYGTIVNEHGDSVASVRSFQFGIGRFQFTPQAAHTYSVLLTLPSGHVVKKELPQAYAQGYVMQLHRQSNGALTVDLSVSSGMQDRTLYLLAQNHQKIQLALAKPIANGHALFEVDTATLAQGITCFTVFNEAQKPVCERLYFKKPISEAALRLTSDQPQYGTRKKVELTLHANNLDTAALLDLSLAVFKNDALQDSNRTNIASYLWLTSELSERVEAPAYYFSDDPNVTEATDNLMLTHGWRRFRWESVLNASSQQFSFAPEIHGHLVRALVTDIHSGRPAAGVHTFLSVPGNPFLFQASQSDSSGMAVFDIKNQYGPGELIFQTNTEYDSGYHVELLPAFAQTFTTEPLPALTFSKAHNEVLLQQSIGMQVQNIYNKDSLSHFQLPAAYDTIPFYGKPDYTYALDLYTRFSTMEEVLREYVRPINVVQRRGEQHLLILDEARRQFFDGGELVLLDGIPLFNKNKIFSYDPLKIKKLDVVTHKYFIGPGFFNGIASFTTYNGNYEGLQLDPHAVIIDYEGLQLEREFYAPVYETSRQIESRMPDFRSTLLWEPHVNVANGTATISFYTSDVKGIYTVELEGLDKNGQPLVAKLPIDVH